MLKKPPTNTTSHFLQLICSPEDNEVKRGWGMVVIFIALPPLSKTCRAPLKQVFSFLLHSVNITHISPCPDPHLLFCSLYFYFGHVSTKLYTHSIFLFPFTFCYPAFVCLRCHHCDLVVVVASAELDKFTRINIISEQQREEERRLEQKSETEFPPPFPLCQGERTHLRGFFFFTFQPCFYPIEKKLLLGVKTLPLYVCLPMSLLCVCVWSNFVLYLLLHTCMKAKTKHSL